jgi:serine/threonine-protein kinase
MADVGDVLDGKYRVDRVIGQGGMGVVLGATHLALEKRVAVKLLLPEMLSNAAVVVRFEREARAAAMLRSEHVVRILDVGFAGEEGPYMVMEFLEGQDLEALAEQRGPLPIHVAVDYVLQVCRAIGEAHERGVIHRDLKPPNLFLTRRFDGTPLVKVLDFGISKVTDLAEQVVTRTSDILGSPHYMSPEQMRGVRTVDTRTDIWALGAILYRLVAGRPPFDGENIPQVCSRVMTAEPPPLGELRADVPEGLAHAIERCLRRDPAARYPEVADFASAIAPFASRSVPAPTSSVPPSAPATHLGQKPRSNVPVFAGAALTFLLAGAGVAAWRHRRAVPPASKAAATLETSASTRPDAGIATIATPDAGPLPTEPSLAPRKNAPKKGAPKRPMHAKEPEPDDLESPPARK